MKYARLKEGAIYLSEKTSGGEGWKEVEVKNPSTGETSIKYHKDVSLEGVVVDVKLDDDRFKGRILDVVVQTDDDTYVITFPIMSNGTIKTTNAFFNSIVGPLLSMETGQKVKMFANNRNKDKNGKYYRNIVLLTTDDKIIKSDYNFDEVPRWNSKEAKDDFGETKTEWDPSPANKFYIGKMNELVERWKTGGIEAPVQAPTETTAAPEVENDTSLADQLPF